MNTYQICFSPTGGTKKIADIIGFVLKDDIQCIDMMLPREDFSKYSFEEDDVCIVAIPSFGGRVPTPAAERLSEMSGGNARAILLCSYGNRHYDDTLLELEGILTAGGFRCVAAVAAVAQHSIMPKFGAGRPDEKDSKELENFALQIAENLKSGSSAAEDTNKPENCSAPFVPVSVPGKESFQEYGGLPLKPEAGKKCNLCGICADKCPVGAIDPKNPKETDKAKCITCMQCVAVCPEEARKLNGLMLAVAEAKMKKACSERKGNQLFL